MLTIGVYACAAVLAIGGSLLGTNRVCKAIHHRQHQAVLANTERLEIELGLREPPYPDISTAMSSAATGYVNFVSTVSACHCPRSIKGCGAFRCPRR